MTTNELDQKNQILLYKGTDGQYHVEVLIQNDTVWLSQKQMALLFDRNVRTISEHIENIFKEHELDKDAVIRKFRITASDGKIYDILHYNLDMIISLGYRVNSLRGTQFRIWATRTLK